MDNKLSIRICKKPKHKKSNIFINTTECLDKKPDIIPENIKTDEIKVKIKKNDSGNSKYNKSKIRVDT